jgi:hypothetical protein
VVSLVVMPLVVALSTGGAGGVSSTSFRFTVTVAELLRLPSDTCTVRLKVGVVSKSRAAALATRSELPTRVKAPPVLPAVMLYVSVAPASWSAPPVLPAVIE